MAKKTSKKETTEVGKGSLGAEARQGAAYQASVEIIRKILADAEVARARKSFPIPEPTKVCLAFQTMKGVRTLEALAEFQQIETLAFWCGAVKDLNGVQHLPKLKHLSFDRKTKVKGGLQPLRGIPLESLRVGPSLFDQLRDLDLSELRELHLWDAALSSLDFLPCLPKLKKLHVGWRSVCLTSFRSFDRVPRVEVVSLGEAKRLKNCDGLDQCPSLRVLEANHSSVQNLEGLRGHPGLEVLELRGAPLSDLAPLYGCPSLKTLRVERTKVKDLAGIAEGLPVLKRLDLWGTKAQDLEPIAGLSGLRYLALSGLKPRSWAFLSRLTSLELLDLCNSSFEDLSLIGELPKLRRVRLTDTAVKPDVAGVKPLAETLRSRGGGVSFSNSGQWPHDEDHQGKLGLIE